MSAAARPAPGLRGTLRRLARELLEPPLPLLAVEVRPQALAAVRLAVEHRRLTLAAAASVELPPGALEVSLTRPNLLDPEAFGSALRAVLERVGAFSGGAVSLVLPDPAVRMALVPSAGLRARGREAEETIRFRLHKALPFDVHGARLAWCPAGEQTLVAVAPQEVVGGYEEALAALGYEVGLVEVASLALASGLGQDGPPLDRLLVNWDRGYVSFTLLRGGAPLLVRTLPGEDEPDAVARHATGTLQFHRDRLAGQEVAEVVVRCAAAPGETAVEALGRVLPTKPQLLAPWAALGLAENGAAAQAVAGAAASAARRAA
jgi:hypothetical protein